jgi:hypothetical protein
VALVVTLGLAACHLCHSFAVPVEGRLCRARSARKNHLSMLATAAPDTFNLGVWLSNLFGAKPATAPKDAVLVVGASGRCAAQSKKHQNRFTIKSLLYSCNVLIFFLPLALNANIP